MRETEISLCFLLLYVLFPKFLVEEAKKYPVKPIPQGLHKARYILWAHKWEWYLTPAVCFAIIETE